MHKVTIVSPQGDEMSIVASVLPMWERRGWSLKGSEPSPEIVTPLPEPEVEPSSEVVETKEED